MSNDRLAVPRALERRLKEESGYRCAIPRCGGTVRLELAHIEPWAKVKEHTFENMICLCGDCHWRYDKLEQIPKPSIVQFKRNLSLLSHRYTQVENQVLRHYGKIAAEGADPRAYAYAVHPGMMIFFTSLFEDKLFAAVDDPNGTITVQGVAPNVFLVPTNQGCDFITRMVEAADLENGSA